MGSETTTQLVFFIATTLVATIAAGILTGVVTDLTEKVEIRGRAFGEQVVSEIKIVNDPGKVPVDPETIFYIKNTGATTFSLDTVSVLLDGQIVDTTETLLGGETQFRPGATAKIVYASTTGAGDHRVRIVMENGVADEMQFRV